MNARAITYVEHQDGNEQIEKAKQRLFYLAPDISTAIVRDAITIKEQAARIAELEAGLEAATAELEMQLCIRWNCTHDEIRAVNKYVIAARALLETK